MPKMTIKAVVLFMLIGLTIYQIGLLWFDYPSDRNFFYSIIDQNVRNSTHETNTNYNLLYPIQIGIYAGRNTTTYNVLSMSNTENNNLATDGLKVISEAFESGVALERITKEDLFDNKHILFVMPFPINNQILVGDLGIEAAFSDEVFAFERVYIYPGESGDENLEVVFADNQLNHLYRSGIYIANNKLLNEAILQYIQDPEEVTGQSALTYVSSTQSEINVFNEEVLLPSNGQYFNYLKSMYGEIYFYDNQDRDLEGIEEYFSYYFVNPDNTWSTDNGNSVRYGDFDSVVSYTQQGVFDYELIEELEYTNTNIGTAYEVVESFLERDKLLSTIEYTLDRYEYNSKGITFYYNYSYRDIPLVFEGCESKYNMLYPMEITVLGENVTHYSRLLFKTQEVVVQGNPFEVRFLQPIDILLSRENNEDLQINDMHLGYHVGDTLDNIQLMWVVDVSEVRYFIELE